MDYGRATVLEVVILLGNERLANSSRATVVWSSWFEVVKSLVVGTPFSMLS